jgi:hypothetical protein
MKISDVLRQVADAIDHQENPAVPDEQIHNPAQLSPTAAGTPVEAPSNQDLGADDEVMIPPLHLKTELLKKAVGVDSVFDAGEPRADQAHDNQNDELDRIRGLAGVPVVAISELSDDEPLES